MKNLKCEFKRECLINLFNLIVYYSFIRLEQCHWCDVITTIGHDLKDYGFVGMVLSWEFICDIPYKELILLFIALNVIEGFSNGSKLGQRSNQDVTTELLLIIFV